MSDGADRPASQRWITAAELDGRADRLETLITGGIERLSNELKTTRHAVKNDMSALTLTVGLHGRDIEDLKLRDREAKADRRRHVGYVMTIAGMVSGLVMWVVEFVRSVFTHKP